MNAVPDTVQEMGLDMTRIVRDGTPTFEVHSVRPTRRVGPDGQFLADVVIEVTQRRPGYFDADVQTRVENGQITPPPPDFWFRGGATLIVDLDTGTVRYSVAKNIWSDKRLARQRDYLGGHTDNSLRAMYFGRLKQDTREPFAFLHRMGRQ